MLLSSAPPHLIDQLRPLIAGSKRIAIVTHFNPDGDAMGSSLGLAHVLSVLGHTVKVVLPNTPPANLLWLPGAPDAIPFDREPEAAVNAIGHADVLFCLDFNRTDRVGGLTEAVRAAPFKVLIDHHQEPEPFAQVMFSDTTACATCQMVYDVVNALGLAARISVEAATCLYTGIVTDSGSFRYRNTTPHTMRVAAELIERGLQVELVHHALVDDNSLDRLKLLGFTLNERMTVLPELGTCIIQLSRADLKRFNFQPGDTEGFVNYGLSIRGIRLAAFFIERADQVKISLRSKGNLPVDRFVKAHFDGGGHSNAAGGQTKETIDAAVERFRAHLPEFIQAHPA
jgi:bifunctional oligoribonuclease and PAP phosphatase NrnA